MKWWRKNRELILGLRSSTYDGLVEEAKEYDIPIDLYIGLVLNRRYYKKIGLE